MESELDITSANCNWHRNSSSHCLYFCNSPSIVSICLLDADEMILVIRSTEYLPYAPFLAATILHSTLLDTPLGFREINIYMSKIICLKFANNYNFRQWVWVRTLTYLVSVVCEAIGIILPNCRYYSESEWKIAACTQTHL